MITFSERIPYDSHEPTKEKRRLTVIRNFTMEPYFDQYVRYYMPGTEIAYCYLEQALQNEVSPDEDLLVFLQLPLLFPDTYFSVYRNDSSDKWIEENKNRLFDLIDHILALSQTGNQLFFVLFTETERRVPVEGQSTFDLLAKEGNQYLYRKLEQTANLKLIDSCAVFRNLGYTGYYDIAGSYQMEAAVSRKGLNRIAHELAGKAEENEIQKKCIVTDLDGVLWGGILSEDGIDGILLSGSGIGRAYKEFQRELLKLKDQGYILCISSKNEESEVKEAFCKHKDMVLSWDDFASYRISFENKAEGIRQMSEELHMPIEAMVFIEDTPFEAEQAQTLLQMDTILLDANAPHKYIDRLYASGYFYKTLVSNEDRKRPDRYRSTRHAAAIKGKPEEINMTMKTEVSIHVATPAELHRVAQMSLRTHQFNLSGIRYSYEQLKARMDSGKDSILCMHVKDRYGDLGIVASVVLRQGEKTLVVESFFMSCRVLGRDFEEQMMRYIAEYARQIGADRLQGVYRETEKNRKFRGFYERFGVETQKE